MDMHYNMTAYDEWSNTIDITSTPTLWNTNPDLSPFHEEDIEEMYGEREISNDWDWSEIKYGKLKDGRYFYYGTWADMTFGNTSVVFGASREDIERYGLDEEDRKYFGIVLE